MVGFGSSLRKARRPGWDDGYLDYETLKLLLSQIEAVYEEVQHGQSNGRGGGGEQGDFRNELFQVADSDAAFASSNDERDAFVSDGGGPSFGGNGAKAFLATFSHDSSDDDSHMRCACASFGRPAPRPPEVRTAPSPTGDPESDFYSVQVYSQDTFYLAGESSDTVNNLHSHQRGPSFLNAPIREFATESSSLLPPAASFEPRNDSSTFGSPVATMMRSSNTALDYGIAGGSGSPISMMKPGLPPIAPTTATKLNEERKRERRARRARKLNLKSRRRQQQVPRHLRIAHSKARAITERFLGLLRAETEKVLLFAQARLGELADGAGSLRFPSHAVDSGLDASAGAGRTTPYGYPLADGGLHPSASSSDDECIGGGAFRNGRYAWSDDSSADNEATSRSSHCGAADETVGRTNRTRGMMSSPNGDSHNKVPLEEIQRASAVLNAARRQIDRFADIRKAQPLFQRNDHILGEDLLFLSAVEEADGFTAVGVELMHVLRFICVNLIAVRKICRKHDRLLMNRMLGGYYHRLLSENHASGNKDHAHVEASTLGGLMAQASGDIYEAHPALIGQMNHYKLVGMYDLKIQNAVNSRTVQVVSSCLALALAEYEVARSRADALTKLNSAFDTAMNSGCASGTDDGSLGALSTSSSISLTRLRFTVTAVFALREAARYKSDPLSVYLSRSTVTYTGGLGVAEGMDGCSRDTLDFLVGCNPDTALLLESSVLYAGLKDGSWTTASVSEVMISALATTLISERLPAEANIPLILSEGQDFVRDALCIAPQSKNMMLQQILRGKESKTLYWTRTMTLKEVPTVSLWLSHTSALLFAMNYFVAHATTNTFVKSSGGAAAYSAIVIAAPNISAILGAFLQCRVFSGQDATRAPRRSVNLIRRTLIVCSLFGALGNMLHGLAVIHNLIPLAFFGRLVYGFSASDIAERYVMSLCLPSQTVASTARHVRCRMIGIVAGLLLGSVAEGIPITIESIGIREIQSTSWFMMFLWLIQLAAVLLRVKPRAAGQDTVIVDGRMQLSDSESGKMAPYVGDSQSSGSDEIRMTPSSLYHVSPSDMAQAATPRQGSRKRSFDTTDEGEEGSTTATPGCNGTLTPQAPGGHHLKDIKAVVKRIRKLLGYRVSVRICLLVLAYSSFGLEVFFTATPIITSRYFAWSGSPAGIMLGIVASCIVPVSSICERVARKYEERYVVKTSVLVIGAGLLIMVNWLSLFSLVTKVPSLWTDTKGRITHFYDWRFGMYQYVLGLFTVFAGLVAMDGASRSLLSKVSPPCRRGPTTINVGTIVTFLSLLARLAADLQILMVDLSHKLINTDIVNALLIPFFFVLFLIAYLVRKRYFFLM